MSCILDDIFAILSHPCTSAEFLWSEPRPGKGGRQFYYFAQNAAKSGFGDHFFISCSRAVLSGSEQEQQVGRENGGEAKWRTDEPGTQKPVSICPCQLQQACLSRLMERMTRNGPGKDSTKEHLPPKHPSNLSCRAASLPALHHCWLNSSSHQQLSCHPWRELFQLPNILAKSTHPSTHLLQVENLSKNTLYVSECR